MQDVDLIQRLNLAESDLLTSLLDGTQMLASYHQTWSALPGELSTLQNGNIGHETLSLAHLVANRISKIATCFLDIKRDEEFSTAQLQSDCDAMLHRMATLDLSENTKSSKSDNRNDTGPFHSYPSTSISNAECSSPPFLAAAHQWLLDNLHNPYPSAKVKARMAAASSCQVSSINSWFVNARRRIGWTTLCRKHFSNCRADMISAAYRALVEEDPQRALSPELQHSFIAMRVAVEDLYPSALTRSISAGDLDATVKDVTKGNGEFTEVRQCCQVKQADLTKVVQDSYPSPDPSIMSSPVSTLSDSLTVESGKNDSIAPPVVAGSKRHWSSTEPVDQPSSTTSRPIKRLRASATSQTCLPSPPSSTGGIDESSHPSSPELPHAHSTLPETNEMFPSRERCLSDADATGTPQRPHGSTATPHLQAVSDSLPSSTENEYSIDDWFNVNFDALFAIPPPIDATEPDISAGWEVELFKDYSIPGNSKCTSKCPPASTYMPLPSDLSDLDSLLQSIGSDTVITPAESLLQSAMTATSYTASLDSPICDVSRTSIDWTSLLNGTEACQPAICPTFSRYPTDSQLLPEIDLSMLQFPQIIPVVNPKGDSTSKHSKLQQLHAMQEAVWRMEQELRSEGVVM